MVRKMRYKHFLGKPCIDLFFVGVSSPSVQLFLCLLGLPIVYYLYIFHKSFIRLHLRYSPEGGSSAVQLVTRWTTDHSHLSSNLGVCISEECFIFDFASLVLEVARPIQPTICTKVAVKHQSSSHLQKYGISFSDVVYIRPVSDAINNVISFLFEIHPIVYQVG